MITLIGSILGFATSMVPNILAIFKAKQDLAQSQVDHQHEMEMAEFDLKSKLALAGVEFQQAQANIDAEQMKGIYANASQPVGYAWVEGLTGTVRPVITYSYFALVAFMELAMTMHLMSSGMDIMKVKNIVLDDDVMALFATILSFWFGHRMMAAKEK